MVALTTKLLGRWRSSTPPIAVVGLFSWAFGVPKATPKAKFPGPAVLWAVWLILLGARAGLSRFHSPIVV